MIVVGRTVESAGRDRSHSRASGFTASLPEVAFAGDTSWREFAFAGEGCARGRRRMEVKVKSWRRRLFRFMVWRLGFLKIAQHLFSRGRLA
jgi:hypothetical protein